MVEERDFIGQEFLQHCGDILKVLKKSNKKQWTNILYECEFLKYPYKVFVIKKSILRGEVLNPQIEQVEFVEKIWPQHCGDSLRIIKKSSKKIGRYTLFECEFIKYPCKIFALKDKIIKGTVNNPQIEQIEFFNKIWFQHCGDILRIIRKTNKKQGNNCLYECEFINYPYKTFSLKQNIIKGEVLNPNAPWVDIEESQVRDFIKSIYNGKVEKYSGKKEDNYYEIDIYLPELKKGIEYNGSPWHEEGNPNNKFSKPIGYHQTKQELFAKKGIEILFIWDYEWFEDFPKNKIINKQTQQKIREFLNI